MLLELYASPCVMLQTSIFVATRLGACSPGISGFRKPRPHRRKLIRFCKVVSPQNWALLASVLTGCKTRSTVTTMPTMLALVLASLCCLASTLVAAAAPAPAKPQLLSWNGKPTMCLTGPSTLGATVRTGCSQPALPDLAGGCMSPRSASSSLAATNVACLDSYGRTPCS
jgi:hypothetical protein